MGFLRSIFKRCMSDGNILQESETKVLGRLSGSALSDRSQVGTKVLCDSSPNISTTEIETTFSRYAYFSLYLVHFISAHMLSWLGSITV